MRFFSGLLGAGLLLVNVAHAIPSYGNSGGFYPASGSSVNSGGYGGGSSYYVPAAQKYRPPVPPPRKSVPTQPKKYAAPIPQMSYASGHATSYSGGGQAGPGYQNPAPMYPVQPAVPYQAGASFPAMPAYSPKYFSPKSYSSAPYTVPGYQPSAFPPAQFPQSPYTAPAYNPRPAPSPKSYMQYAQPYGQPMHPSYRPHYGASTAGGYGQKYQGNPAFSGGYGGQAGHQGAGYGHHEGHYEVQPATPSTFAPYHSTRPSTATSISSRRSRSVLSKRKTA